MSNNKITFKTVDSNGNEITLDVRKPTSKVQTEADKILHKTLIGLLRVKEDEATSIPRSQIAQIMKDRNLWDDDRQKELESIEDKIQAGERTIKEGGIKKMECRKVAIQLRKDRMYRSLLVSKRDELDNLSCESKSENRQFEYLVSACTLDSETGDPYFKNLDDYDNRKEEKAAIDAATNLAYLVWGVDPNYVGNLPENKFLKDYGYADDEYRLIDSQGRLCDEDFRLVNKDGRYVNEKDELIDRDGNRVNEDGSPYVEFKEFLED